MSSQTVICGICALVGVENFSAFQFESCDVFYLFFICKMFSFMFFNVFLRSTIFPCPIHPRSFDNQIAGIYGT